MKRPTTGPLFIVPLSFVASAACSVPGSPAVGAGGAVDAAPRSVSFAAPDAGRLDGSAAATAGEVGEPGVADLGLPCTEHGDCEQGLCVAVAGGAICSVHCVESCPSGFGCQAVPTGDADVFFACIPKAPPCTAVGATDHTCDGIDDDCDGVTDEDVLAATITCGAGACVASGTRECIDGVWEDVCTRAAPLAAADVTCDGVDDDCDGLVDEDFAPIPSACGAGVCQAFGLVWCEGGAEMDDCTPPCAGPACELPGACLPGTTVECKATCGTGTRTCGADCAFSECSAPAFGPCVPGTQETQTCAPCLQRTRVCAASCNWGPFGECATVPGCDPKCLLSYPDGCRPFTLTLPAGTPVVSIDWWPAQGGAMAGQAVSPSGGTFDSPYGACAATVCWPGQWTGAPEPAGSATVCGNEGAVPLCALPLGGFGVTHDGACAF